ncbi:MAG: 23S rRNA (pseudouridine(1915)-N(3))-methyltransferase RlmH [Acidaminococcaceae bacterium]|nr:23S rRNA (pseudouridine(1915)-N(3))-methyltransferase RlmH [Acidaminococcaceae bacterium]
MQITIACVGKIKEKYLVDGVAEYTKRLGPFCRLKIVSISEEKMPDNPSPANKEQVLIRETTRLLAIIPDNSYVFVLDVIGKPISSPELAQTISDLALEGKSNLTFVIGGAFGFTDALRARADVSISFSKMTFTHQMIRMLLVEQIYRAFKIIRGEKYHW